PDLPLNPGLAAPSSPSPPRNGTVRRGRTCRTRAGAEELSETSGSGVRLRACSEVGPVPYSLTMVRRELHRYLPAVLAVAFSAVLVALQCGLLVGFLSVTSRPIDRAGADLWVGPPGVATLGDGPPISEAWRARLAAEPEVAEVEPYLFGFGAWHR